MQIHNIVLLASYWEVHCLYSQLVLLTTTGDFTTNNQSLHGVVQLWRYSNRLGNEVGWWRSQQPLDGCTGEPQDRSITDTMSWMRSLLFSLPLHTT